MASAYEILGVPEGAKPHEVRSAYARLIREHTPDKDPKGFQRLRRAYEELKNREESSGPVFPPFSQEAEKALSEQIEDFEQYRQWEKMRDTAEEAVSHFPESTYFLYKLIQAQIKAGNSGKAVKNAERLAAMEAGNVYFTGILAEAYYERGYHAKAWKAFREAGEKGLRDISFIAKYAEEYNEKPEGRILELSFLLEAMQKKTSWNRDELGKGLFLGDMIVHDWSQYYYKRRDFQEYFDAIVHFVGQNAINLARQVGEAAELLDHATYLVSSGNGNAIKVSQAFASLKNAASDQDDRDDIEEREGNCVWKLFNEDEGIKRTITELCRCQEAPKSVRHYAEVDATLCILSEWEDFWKALPYARREYPMLVEPVNGIIERLPKEDKDIGLMKEALKRELKTLTERGYSGSSYYEWYPEEREKAHGRLVASGGETYIRPGKKIGRNDPCPCGSGKKYKNCCMNKKV